MMNRNAAVLVTAFGAVLVMLGLVEMSQPGEGVRPDPQEPRTYLLFAEQIISVSSSPADRVLATQAALHGGWIARESGDDSLAASCLIAAAKYAPDPDRADLWDAALMLDPSRIGAWRSQRDQMETSFQPAIETLLEARYSFPRRDDSEDARSRARNVFLAVAQRAGYSMDEADQALTEALDHADRDDCQGRVFLPSRTAPNTRVLCDDHARPIGALHSDEDFLLLLHAEMALHGVRGSTWASGERESGNPPLKDPSLAGLMESYMVSPSRPYWRDAQWVAAP